MSLQGQPLSAITESDLQHLTTESVRESQTLEYKRQAYSGKEEDTREMLHDISSMANAFGGDLLIGIEEDGEGVASAIPGIEGAESEAARMVSSCLSNIQERIPGLATHVVPLSNGRDS
jgi:predicted HTH transcriptional regulator